MAKVPMSSISVFTLEGDSVLCVSNQFTLTVNNEVVDASCLNDTWVTRLVTGKDWSLSIQGQINTEVYGTAQAISTPQVTVAFTTGAGTYGGEAIIVSATHSGTRRAEQTETIELQGSGALTYTAPA